MSPDCDYKRSALDVAPCFGLFIQHTQRGFSPTTSIDSQWALLCSPKKPVSWPTSHLTDHGSIPFWCSLTTCTHQRQSNQSPWPHTLTISPWRTLHGWCTFSPLPSLSHSLTLSHSLSLSLPATTILESINYEFYFTLLCLFSLYLHEVWSLKGLHYWAFPHERVRERSRERRESNSHWCVTLRVK